MSMNRPSFSLLAQASRPWHRQALLATLAACGALSAGLVQAQDQPVGRVLSTSPVVQQVALPSQVCSPERYVSREPSSGAGAIVGAIAGGLLGNTVGHGSGRVAATMAGVVGGAMVGNRVEGNGGTRVQDVDRCYNETRYEERTVAYKVVYEYAGRQYQTQLAYDPGEYIPLQVSPAGSVATTGGTYPAGTTTVTTTSTVRRGPPVYIDASPPPVTVYMSPGYYHPGPPGWGPVSYTHLTLPTKA